MRNPGLRLFVALCCAAAAARAEDPAPAAKARALTDWEKKIVEKINGFRKLAGVKEVAVDVGLSNACQKHSDYLVKNYASQKAEGAKGNDEIEGRAGYTEEGKKAGLASDIAYVEPIRALDECIASLFQRASLLQPDLEKIGIGVSCPNRDWYVVLDTKSKVTAESPVPYALYPADKQAAVPLQYAPEGRNPVPGDTDGRAGYPVTVTFRRFDKIDRITATLKDSRGKEVPVWLVKPDSIPDFEHLRTIAMFSQDPLEKTTTYTASFEAEVNGTMVTKSWSFTTGKK
jgi:uncharacterized protein YkwD